MKLNLFKTAAFAVLSVFLFNSAAIAQKSSHKSKEAASIKWMSFEEAIALNNKKPKKILVDLYTDWCSWCKKMDAETFTDSAMIEYINDKFYAVKFNAEQKEPIRFKDKEFVNPNPEKARSTHQLALALLKNQPLYPSYVILDGSGDWLYKIKGYKTPGDMLPLLKYYGDDAYLTKSWSEYTGLNK